MDISGQAANPAVGQPFVDGSLTGADIENGSLTGADVQNGSIGSTKLAASARGARAYGRVASDTSVVGSKNITGVTNPVTGYYCLTLGGGIDPATAAAVVTPNYANDATRWSTNGDQSIAEVSGLNVTCPGGTLEVQTGYRSVITSSGVVNSVNNIHSNQGFFIVVG